MIDIQYIRDNPEIVKEKSKQKGYPVDIDELLRLDIERKELLSGVEALRQKRNEIAAKMKSGKPEPSLVEDGKQIKLELVKQEELLNNVASSWLTLLKKVPNMPLEDVPVGTSEDQNIVSKEWGTKPEFHFTPKNHAQIAESKGWIDKERAARVAGSRFAYIKGDLALLHWAVLQYAINKLTDKKFIESVAKEQQLNVSMKPFLLVLPPLMIRTDLYDAMDRLEPREDRYKIEGEELWLQGSAEHVLGSMHANETIDEDEFPIRYLGYATSFRQEAGNYGKDMEGIFRLHQFDKLEMESLCLPEHSYSEHLLMIAIQEKLMQGLEIPYRVLNKCTADIGKPNAHGVDIDAWLPGQNNYRETHTADYMGDYQSRRLQTKVKRADKIELVHTNDATAFSQRPLIAIIENYQTKDGDVAVPEALKPYLNGRELL